MRPKASAKSLPVQIFSVSGINLVTGLPFFNIYEAFISRMDTIDIIREMP